MMNSISVIILLILSLLYTQILGLSLRSPHQVSLLRIVDGVPLLEFPVPLVDPQTKVRLKMKTRIYGFIQEKYLEGRAKYPIKKDFIDLTIAEEVDRPVWTISNRERISSRLFQNPLISTIYERGYRQNFQAAGFPGPELECAEAIEFFLPEAEGVTGLDKTVVDLSCGSGFMSRLFTKSGRFGNIVSADLSPNMLQETRRRFLEEGLTPPETVRLDSAKLPFADNSVDFLHAGAAMHCWPRLPQALAEVHRVLKPRGKFFASTFFRTIQGTPGVLKRLGLANRRASDGGMYMFEDEGEIENFLRDAGFCGEAGQVHIRRQGRGCAIVKAMKQ